MSNIYETLLDAFIPITFSSYFITFCISIIRNLFLLFYKSIEINDYKFIYLYKQNKYNNTNTQTSIY